MFVQSRFDEKTDGKLDRVHTVLEALKLLWNTPLISTAFSKGYIGSSISIPFVETKDAVMCALDAA